MSIVSKRGCNYTADEKQILLEIINKYIHILENKKTNGDVNRQKRECWKRVAKHYNSLATTGMRTWAQLRHLYENLKQRMKKNGATENKQIKTGNETFTTTIKDDIPVETLGEINFIETGAISPSSFQVSSESDCSSVSEINDNKKRKTTQKHQRTNLILKEQYFKSKLSNARLERRFMIEKHKLEIKLLKIKINQFRK